MAWYLEHETGDTVNLDENLTPEELMNCATYYSNKKPASFGHAIQLLKELGWKVYTEV